MIDEFDLFVWRRCGHRVVMSARARPLGGVRAFVRWLDRLPDDKWSVLIGCLKVSAGHAADWLMDEGQEPNYARQMLCVKGRYGPTAKADLGASTITVCDDDHGQKYRYFLDGEEVTTPQARAAPEEPAPDCRNP